MSEEMTPTNRVEEAITEAFGERCPDFQPDCGCCQAWAQFDSVKRALDIEIARALK